MLFAEGQGDREARRKKPEPKGKEGKELEKTFQEECPKCGGTALLLELAEPVGFLGLMEGYGFYRCVDCDYAYKRIGGKIKEVSKREADAITERALK